MPIARSSFELFTLTGGIEGNAALLQPATFAELGALEFQHIERWIRDRPELLGEDIKVVANQFDQFDTSKDRLDVLGLDRAGRLVVIEVKRDTSGAYQDLQALRYAALSSTFTAKRLAEAYADYVSKTEGRDLVEDAARMELEDFITAESLDVVDVDQAPRIILVAGGFRPEVTTTVLWLRRVFAIDITCVQLTPYVLGGQIVLGSSQLIPLREAGDFEVQVAEKLQASAKASGASLDHESARTFIEAVPAGRWTSYGEVALAGGSPKGAMGVGSWLSAKGSDVANVYRVLNGKGEVSGGWKAANPALPQTPDAVRELLEAEGVPFIDGRADAELRWRVADWTREAGADRSSGPRR